MNISYLKKKAYLFVLVLLILVLGICVSINNANYKEKYTAYNFLRDNQKFHFTEYGTAVDSFLVRVDTVKSEMDATVLKKIWTDVKQYDKPQISFDKRSVSLRTLYSDITKAVDTWEESPWKDSVSYEMFCDYILPYRLMHESVKQGWRDTLYNKYHPLIANVQDMKTAFEIIHDTISNSFKQTDIGIPYTLSVIDLDKIRHGNCAQRCVYEAAVMRSLGIPTAIDGLHEWANYSTSGHTWVALVTKNGTYTIARGDSVLRKNNPIDSSVFDLKFDLEPNHRFHEILNFKKTCTRVIRYSFRHHKKEFNDTNADSLTVNRFTNPFVMDVTNEYMRTNSIEVKSAGKYNYLCTFKTAYGWIPSMFATSDNNTCVFNNVVDSVMFVCGHFEKGKLVVDSQPFFVSNGNKFIVSPDTLNRTRMCLTRKYPLTAHFLNYWMRMRGGCFEASNDSNFNNLLTLDSIVTTPNFRNEIILRNKGKYRYFRYSDDKGTKHTIAEIQYYGGKRLLNGKISSIKSTDPEKCFDGDILSYSECRKHVTITIDVGIPTRVEKIVYFAQNDDNYVVPDNDYELFYFDNGWKSIGSLHSTDYEIIYYNVPSKALYLLKNKTKGKEERIFTYENGKQIWW